MPKAKTHDWELIASRDPWFGVIASDDYASPNMDAAARRRFYGTGEADIATLVSWFETEFGTRPGGRALDIGCGLGRLGHAMAKVARDVSGYDVSKTMARLANEEAPANFHAATKLPDGPFDWINSYIVFQHIPPVEGLALLRDSLQRAAPGALISLQFAGWRTAEDDRSLLHRLRLLRNRHRHRTGKSKKGVAPLIVMHDYNFSDILALVTAHGFSRLVLHHTVHGAHHGAWILGRRDIA
jgi:SAM-dependent methyltransferase